MSEASASLRLEQIEDARVLLEAIFEHSPVAYQVFRADGRSIFVNQAFMDLFKVAPPPEYNVLEDDVLERQGFLAVVRRAFAGETVRMPPIWYDPRELEQLEVREGRRVGIQVTLFPLRRRGGAIEHIAVCARDVTAELELERERDEFALAAAALRESEERFRVTFEQSAVGIAHVSPEGRWLEVNRRLCDILGYAREDLLSSDFQHITHPDDLERDLRLMRSVLAGERASYSMEKRYVKLDGTHVWADITVALLRDEAGAPKYFITVVQDIADRKRAEAELGEASARLRQAQKMEAIGRLAGGIAHDFNNLLSVILGHASLLMHLPSADEALREGLRQVHEAGERAAALTRQLLAFSRQRVLEPRTIDLSVIIHNVERMLQRLIGEHIRFDTKRAALPCNVHGDASQIEQIVVNLVVNARDAMPNGGMLTIQTERVEITPQHAVARAGLKSGAYVALTVRDTGVGMDQATQDRAFEPFFTTKAVSKGTGLGLSTVFGIVKQHGGHIELRSEIGNGTTFTIYLPRVEGISVAPGPRAQGPSAGGSETVLLVEDEAGVRGVILSILQRAGYEVLVASSGAEALERSSRHAGRIHLLLTDVVMPDMSGPALAAELTIQRADISILYMSGYADDAIALHGGPVQRRAFLQKPVTPETLTRKIREVLGTRGAQARVNS